MHQVAFHARRYYVHRFLHYDSAWRLRGASLPFCFQTRGIEFACGACLSHDGEELLIAYGIDDAEAWLCRLPLSAARALLQPLPVDADASSFL